MNQPPAPAPSGAANPNHIDLKECVKLTLNNKTASVYPPVQASWSVDERAAAYHTTLAGLRTLALPPDQFLDTFGIYMGLQTIVDGLKFDFQDHFDANWLKFADDAVVTILGFHNSAGAVMENAVTPEDRSILKPVQDGVIVNCRPPDVKYVRAQITLNFAPLITVVGQENSTLRAEFYVELPQSMRVVNDGNGNPRNLVSFLGPADIRTLNVQEFKDQILAFVPQDGPVNLVPAAFNVTNATTDETALLSKIRHSVLRIAEPTILHEVFIQLCPNYTNKPQAAVEGISQSYLDPQGNPVQQSVNQYYHRFQIAARPVLANQRVLPCDLVSMFIAGLHPDVKAAFEEQYPNHNEPHDRQSRAQRLALANVLRLATIAEGRVRMVSNVVARQYGQNFMAEGVPSGVPGFASQAERTFQRYSGEPDPATPVKGLGPGQSCFGCGRKSHPWMIKGEIVCPDKDKPGVKALAAENRKKVMAARKARGKQTRLMSGVPKYSDLSSKGKKQMREEVAAALAAASKDDDDAAEATAESPTKKSKTFTFVAQIVVLESSPVSSTGRKPPLPVAINTNLPHIKVMLGTGEPDQDWPEIMCVLDSGASLNTANFYTVNALAKAFPGSVHSIHTAEEFSPILLSGIVQSDGKAVTTELPVAFTFHLPYKLIDGSDATITFACGPHVGVNFILGFPFVISAKLVVDFSENVAECRALACRPFQLEAKRARLNVPSVDLAAVHGHGVDKYQDLKADLDRMEAYMASVYALASHLKEPEPKKVRFEADLVSAASAAEVGAVAADAAALGNPIPPSVGDVPPSFGLDGAGSQLPGEFMSDALDWASGKGPVAGDE